MNTKGLCFVFVFGKLVSIINSRGDQYLPSAFFTKDQIEEIEKLNQTA